MRAYLRTWLRRGRLDRDLERELRFHVEEHTHDLIASGVSADEAKRRARLDLGGVAQVAERVRDGRADAALDRVIQDFRNVLRSLGRTPGLTAAVVTLIALVIGGNTTIYSIIHGILTKPAPGVRARDLVTFDLSVNGKPFNGGNSYPNYVDYLTQSTTVNPLAAADYQRITLTTSSGSYALRGDAVSTNYFDTLGVRPIAGRAFRDGDDRASTSGLPTVISERVQQRYFGGVSDVVGQTIALNGHPATIIGVTSAEFSGAVLGESSEIWVPLIPYMQVHRTERVINDRATMGLGIFGRLVPGTSLAQARAEFATVSERLQAAHPETNKGQQVRPIPYAAIATGSLLSRQGNYFLAIFSTVTLLTLLIVCANVANLMLARAASRQREFALRQSLGASRQRIVGMLVAEGVLLSMLAWMAAYAIAFAASRALTSLLPADPSGTTINADFTPDWKVGAYAFTLALVSTVTFTLVPAISAWRQSVLPWLKAGDHNIVQGRSTLSRTLVIAQLAFSMLLLTSAGFAYRSLGVVSHRDLGYPTDHLLLVTVNTTANAATPAANRVLLDRLLEGMRAIPGLSSVSHVRFSTIPSEPIRRFGTDSPIAAFQSFVGPGYLQTLGIAPLIGQDFTSSDSPRSSPGVVINQRLAETLWPGLPAIGQTIRVGRGQQTVEVIGVMPNVVLSGFSRDVHPDVVLRSARDEPGAPGETTFYVRYSGNVDAIISSIGRALHNLEANVPVVSIQTMKAQLDSALLPVRLISTLLVIFATASLLIAVMGQYAVVAFGVKRRARDFGIRVALGASSSDVLHNVLLEGLLLTGVALSIGFVLSLVVGTVLRGLLYGVTPADPLTHVGVVAVLALTSLVACYLPARRATRIDPVQVLRQE